jgi:hypothetical protein
LEEQVKFVFSSAFRTFRSLHRRTNKEMSEKFSFILSYLYFFFHKGECLTIETTTTTKIQASFSSTLTPQITNLISTTLTPSSTTTITTTLTTNYETKESNKKYLYF